MCWAVVDYLLDEGDVRSGLLGKENNSQKARYAFEKKASKPSLVDTTHSSFCCMVERSDYVWNMLQHAMSHVSSKREEMFKLSGSGGGGGLTVSGAMNKR
jgi:hypothetical protein